MHSSDGDRRWRLIGKMATGDSRQVPDAVYIPVGIGFGFWVPKADYALAKARAIETGKIHFVGLVRGGGALVSSSRETLLNDPICTGEIAWIFPETWGER